MLFGKIRFDYSITYNFNKDTRRPSDVFARMAVLTEGFAALDLLLISALNEELRSSAVLSGLEYSSIRAFIINVLRSFEDKDIEDLNWKRMIGKMLVKFKSAIIKFLDKDRPATNKDLLELQAEILEIERETGIKAIPAYRPVGIANLANGLVMINAASIQTASDETIYIETEDGNKMLSKKMVITEERKLEILTQETRVFKDKATLLVKKPDYLGNSMWDVIYGGHRESMKMGDLDFLMKFHGNHPDAHVMPGDSLEAEIDGAHSLGPGGEIIHKRYIIRKVDKVLTQKNGQGKIFDL